MKYLCALLSLLLSFSCFAWGLKELGEEASVPVTTNAKYVLIGGTTITLALVLFKHEIVDPFQKDTVKHRPLGSASKWGDTMGQLVPNLLYMGGMGIAGYYGDTEGYRRAIGMIKATAYSSLVTNALKYTVREPRPNDHSTRNAFPSGHSTTAFAFAGYVAAEHGWAWGVPATLLSTFVGYSRINDNQHRLTDVTAGATIGWVYGWGISKYQKKEKEKSVASIMPILDTKTAGLSLYKEF